MQNDEFNIKKTLGKSYDRINLRDDEQFSQYTHGQEMVTGEEIIDRLFSKTEYEVKAAEKGDSGVYERDDEPLLETISELKNTIRKRITSWVKNGSLSLFQGDLDKDFDACEFPSEDLLRCIGEKDVLVILRDNDLVVDERLEAVIQEISASEPEPQRKLEVQEPEAKKPPKSQSEGAVAFVKNLQVWNENDVEIIIKQQGKKPVTYTPSTLGFGSSTTEEWKALLGILENGEFQYYSSEKAKKAMYSRIKKKLCSFFEIKFQLNPLDQLKLFELVAGKKGVRKPMFQTPGNQSEADVGAGIDYSGFNKEQILEEIKRLTASSDEKELGGLVKAVEHAKSIGITDDDMKADTLIQMKTSDLDTKLLLNQDRPNIFGKKIGRTYNAEDFPDDPKE